ncbi:MAG TPA: hypothetical protein DGT21_12310 [Armatimonadetes bacterium]|jgi:hypothetical protein|nr:hypothetical protein [Armatimonadota bacterium]
MKEQLDLLFDLQQLDTKIDWATRELNGLDDGTAKRAELSAAEAQLAGLEDALRQANGEQLDKELQLESTETERKDKWGKAYGGTISDPKELASLERKIEELQRRRSKLEDDLLTLYDDIERRTEAADVQRATAERLRQELDTIVATFQTRSAELREVIAQAGGERESVVAGLDAGLLADYEGLRHKTGGLAVAVAKDQLCTGCRVSMSLMIYESVLACKHVVRCEGCRRILHPGK